MDAPEKKDVQERLTIQQKIDQTVSGQRPIDLTSYPYIGPDYKIPFLHVGTDPQLFVDNYVLDHFEDVERVICKPEKIAKPLLEWSDLPWESSDGHVSWNPMIAGAIQDPDDGKFKMWYHQPLAADPYQRDESLCYAESEDALHWHKVQSEKCLPFNEHMATNIVFRNVRQPAVVLNADQSDPQRKFLMAYCLWDESLSLDQRRQTRLAVSPDGLRWTVICEGSDQRHQHESRTIWDESIGQYIAYSQYSHSWHYLPGRTRKIGRQTSPDLIHWSPKEAVLAVEDDPTLPPDMEFHEVSIRKVGGLYLAIVGQCHTEPLWCVGTPGDNWRDQFRVDLALYVSRNGIHFHRAHGPDPWVENGPPGSQDYGYACFSAVGAFTHDGRTIIPYNAVRDKQHWFAVCAAAANFQEFPDVQPKKEFERQRELWNYRESLSDDRSPDTRKTCGLRLREDGWAKLQPRCEFGKVYTKQFVFEGDTLRINADCRYGYIKVEILDPYLNAYEGFAVDDCDPVKGPADQIWHTVRWKGKSQVSELWNKPVRLRFHLAESALYAFKFTSD